MNNYKYSDLATMYLPEEDWIYLPHEGGRRTMANGVQTDEAEEKPLQPIAKRTRGSVAKAAKHIALMKMIPNLRGLQEAARAERAQRDADIAAGLLPPIPVVYVTEADRRKAAAIRRKRRSWHRWDYARRLKFNPMAQRRYSDSGSSDHSEG
jgi:hypothetical protein